jgi:AcrR family transcriptional regulator
MTRTETGEGAHTEWRTWAGPELSPILQSALDAFYENGYHGTSVRDIAQRAGLTVPALYYHHENKEAILASLLDQSILAVITRCRAALADAGDAAEDRFTNLVECLVLYMAHATKNAAMDAEIRALNDERRRAYSTKRRTVETMLTTVIKDGVESGVFDVTSPRDTARALLGMIQAIAVWYRPGGRLAPDAVARSYLDIAQHTVGAGRG